MQNFSLELILVLNLGSSCLKLLGAGTAVCALTCLAALRFCWYLLTLFPSSPQNHHSVAGQACWGQTYSALMCPIKICLHLFFFFMVPIFWYSLFSCPHCVTQWGYCTQNRDTVTPSLQSVLEYFNHSLKWCLNQQAQLFISLLIPQCGLGLWVWPSFSEGFWLTTALQFGGFCFPFGTYKHLPPVSQHA